MDLVALIPSFGGLVYTVVAFVVALSVIVAIHEYGHYIIGRLSGIHAEVFSLGFGPVIAKRTDRRGTVWQLSALPFGGYVRFKGDSSAASGKDGEVLSGLSETELRSTMHGAPLWARAATVAAGPIFNFILSIVLFTGVYMAVGVQTGTPVVASVQPLPDLSQSLKPGDRIIELAGQPTPDSDSFAKVAADLPPAASVPYKVERDGAQITVDGPYPQPPVVNGVQPKSAAMNAGLVDGDVITSVDGQPINAFNQLRDKVGSSSGKPMTLQVWHAGTTKSVVLTPLRRDLPLAGGAFETRWLIGVTGGQILTMQTRTPSPGEAISRAASQVGTIVQTSLSALFHIVAGKISACNLSGPIGIAETSSAAASQGLATFVAFIAMLSTGVGLLNLFPVPVLDGGHLVFFAWEAAFGRPPSDRALKVLMGGGFVLIIALMLFAISNDLFCH